MVSKRWFLLTGKTLKGLKPYIMQSFGQDYNRPSKEEMKYNMRLRNYKQGPKTTK
jgi:hypothetical protein